MLCTLERDALFTGGGWKEKGGGPDSVTFLFPEQNNCLPAKMARMPFQKVVIEKVIPIHSPG